MDVDDSPRSGGSTPVQDEAPGTPVMDEVLEPGTPLQDEGYMTPVQDERPYGSKASPQDAEMESDNETDRGGGGMLANNDDEYVSDGGEVEREEIEQDIDEEPQSPGGSPPQSPDADMSPKSPLGSPPASPAASGPQSPGSPQSGPQSPAASPRSNHSGPLSPAGSPVGSPQSGRSGSPPASPAGSGRSRSPSPGQRSQSGSPARSRSGSHARSRSGSPARSRSGSPGRSRSGSPARSRSGSPARSRSGSPARSRSGSPARSRSGSPVRSRSGSPRSRSGSPRSRSGSPRSRSGSPRSRSGSPRSRSGSPRSRSGSPARSRSGSPRSRSGSPARSRSGTPRSRSGSRSRSRSRSGSPARSRSPSPASDNEGKATKKKGSDDEDDSDKESEVGELIANIFGSSDEEEEFEGFDKDDIEAANKKKEKKKSTAVVSDDDSEGGKATGAGNDVVPELSDDENIDALRSGNDRGEFVSDFDLMMEKKKAEQRKNRRKSKKDGVAINDHDDLIADLICRMKEAAEEDRELNKLKKPAVRKLCMLPEVTSYLQKADLQEAFLENHILSAMTEWLAPLPDKSLVHLQIRENFLKILQMFPVSSPDTDKACVNPDSLKNSGLGKAIMYLYKHPRETRDNRERCGKLINEWSRPIFSLTANHKLMSKEEREERDYAHLPKRRRLSAEGMTPRRDIDKVLAGEDQTTRPGTKGFIMRARVPMPSNKDYVVRPKWNSEYEIDMKAAKTKKNPSRYEKHVRAFADRKKNNKSQRAVGISIEGRNMAL